MSATPYCEHAPLKLTAQPTEANKWQCICGWVMYLHMLEAPSREWLRCTFRWTYLKFELDAKIVSILSLQRSLYHRLGLNWHSPTRWAPSWCISLCENPAQQYGYTKWSGCSDQEGTIEPKKQYKQPNRFGASLPRNGLLEPTTAIRSCCRTAEI